MTRSPPLPPSPSCLLPCVLPQTESRRFFSFHPSRSTTSASKGVFCFLSFPVFPPLSVRDGGVRGGRRLSFSCCCEIETRDRGLFLLPFFSFPADRRFLLPLSRLSVPSPLSYVLEHRGRCDPFFPFFFPLFSPPPLSSPPSFFAGEIMQGESGFPPLLPSSFRASWDERG